ncbi:UNVERIFIED_CONTAM: hypothetical protein FKN15_061893 [Acipenser sinensis]
MEAAQVGVIRDSMLANPLLIRADLGRSRSRAFTLPGKEFVFGKPNVTTDGGVPEEPSVYHQRPGRCLSEYASLLRSTSLCFKFSHQADLGRSRSRAFTLPGKEFVFGKPNVTTDGGVPEVMSHWSTLVPVTHSDSKPRKAGQDFMALNREAVKSGLVTAHEHYQFRATHNLKLRPPKVEARLDRSPPDITFGVHTR